MIPIWLSVSYPNVVKTHSIRFQLHNTWFTTKTFLLNYICWTWGSALLYFGASNNYQNCTALKLPLLVLSTVESSYFMRVHFTFSSRFQSCFCSGTNVLLVVPGPCLSCLPTRTVACTRTRSTPASTTSTQCRMTTTTVRGSSSTWVTWTLGLR